MPLNDCPDLCPLSKVEKPISEVTAYCVLHYFCALLTLWKMELTLQEAQLGGRDYVEELDVYFTEQEGEEFNIFMNNNDTGFHGIVAEAWKNDEGIRMFTEF